MKKIDTHQHLLYPEHFAYSWTKDFPDLQGAFTLESYQEAAQDSEIESTLFMEVDIDAGQYEGEAKFFTEMCNDSANTMKGVIAKCLPESLDFPAQLESIRSPALKGIRRVLHTQADELSQSKMFRENVARLANDDLSFDLCVTQQQLPIALELVRACPDVRFILNHCGVPSIAEHNSTDSESWQQWQAGIHKLASCENIVCKFSGITAYAKPEQSNVEGLSPYLNEILEAFGTQRIVWGGDWPVCNLGKGLKSWCELSDRLLAGLSPNEQDSILRGNARLLYKL